jgi:replication factor C small subunit
MNDLWITKYKPQSLDDIISNHDSIEKIKNWLANFDKPNITSSIIISGNHGIGKTIIVSLLLEQYNYEFEIISSNNIKNKKLLDEIINRFRKNNLYEMLHNITKKYAIIIDDTETISLISEKNNILELYKLNEDKKLFPLIFISSTHHCKLIIDIKKTAIEYRFTNPTTQQLKKFIKNIISNEELNIKSDSILNKFINFSQYDIRRCISNLQDIFFTYGKELIDDHKFDIYMQLSKKKNVDINPVVF